MCSATRTNAGGDSYFALLWLFEDVTSEQYGNVLITPSHSFKHPPTNVVIDLRGCIVVVAATYDVHLPWATHQHDATNVFDFTPTPRTRRSSSNSASVRDRDSFLKKIRVSLTTSPDTPAGNKAAKMSSESPTKLGLEVPGSAASSDVGVLRAREPHGHAGVNDVVSFLLVICHRWDFQVCYLLIMPLPLLGFP